MQRKVFRVVYTREPVCPVELVVCVMIATSLGFLCSLAPTIIKSKGKMMNEGAASQARALTATKPARCS